RPRLARLRGRRARRQDQGAARAGRLAGPALRRLHHLPPGSLQGGGRQRRGALRELLGGSGGRRLDRHPAPAPRGGHARRAEPHGGGMSAPHPELLAWRDEFPILRSRTYLNSCSLGPLSRRSMGYLGEFQALWNSMGASAWYELWLGRLAELRGRVAELLNARPAEVGLLPSVSAGLSVVASAVDYSRRNRVVVSELDFPTQIYQWLVKPGVEVVTVPSDDGIGVSPERWAEFVDERTAVVATSHVFYSTG